ncbi:MAG: exo-alpha-sialidase, partial [Solirubrobacterales bacterium]|nr:exo-alpha-sialidase [Solirubrobacterales bacterium]
SYIANTGKPTPMVLASTDHGASFPQATKITSPGPNSSADRDHIAAGPRNSVYLTWIYDPQASAIKNVCPHQYCDTRSGERDAVIQRSTDGGKTFGAPTPLGANGAFAAPLLVEGNGQVDVLLQHFHVSGKDQTLGAGAEYFTSSRDQGRSWRAPISVSTPSTTIMPRNWWMNGALARDSGGDLYVTWDARRGNGDVGLLAYSSDHGRVWSKPIQVTPGADAPHIVEPAGGPRGVAYVGWLTQQHSGAWAQYVRTFQIAHHRLTTARQVSGAAGTAAIWPGDTFGISTLPGSWLALSWGQVPPGRGGTSQIFARTLRPASPKG